MSVVEAVESEYRAAIDAYGVFDASLRQQLRITGPDASSFLQGMVTNDVEGLAVGSSCYAAMLTVKGSMVADVRVLRRENDFIVDTEPGRGPTVSAFLGKYLISEEAEIHDAPELAALALVGPRAAEVLENSGLKTEGRLVSLLGGLDVLVKREEVNEALATLNAVPRLSLATMQVLRVERGVPQFGVDMTEVTIPLEANLEHAIHYKKGCYIGQEVIARATYRGQMNKKLVRLLVGSAEPAFKTELKVGERKVGWITSVVKSVKYAQNLALGYVHRDFLAAGTTLEMLGSTATLVDTASAGEQRTQPG